MDLNLSDRNVLITGASKGIGYACAERFAAEGCNVHLVARTEADLESARAALLEKWNVRIEFTALDLAAPGKARELMADHADIDILVNNAGAIPSGTIQDIDEDTWRTAWDLKVFGYINTCREAYANMKAAGGGVIINIIGAGGEKPTPGYIAGGAGNAALMAMTRAMGSTSLRDNIRMVGLNPGLIHTERLEALMRSAAERRFGDGDRWQELLDPRYPPGKPGQIADMTAFLASERSAFTTGTVVTVDGGSSAR